MSKSKINVEKLPDKSQLNDTYDELMEVSNDEDINRMIILKVDDLSTFDLKDENNELLIYAEDLVKDDKNHIVSYEVSKIFSNTVYLKFKHYFSLVEVEKNYKNRSTLKSKRIIYFRPQDTYKALIGLNSDNESRKTLVDYLKKSSFLLSVNENKNFLICHYKSLNDFELQVKKTLDKIFVNRIVVEYLYSNELIENIFDKEKKFSNFKVSLSSNQEPRVKDLFFDKTLHDNIQKDLLTRNGIFSKIVKGDDYKMICEYNGRIPDEKDEYDKLKSTWQKEITAYFELIFKNYKIENMVKEINTEPKIEDKKLIKQFTILTSKEEPKIKKLFLNQKCFKQFESKIKEKECRLIVKYSSDLYEFICQDIGTQNDAAKRIDEIKNYTKLFFKSFDDKVIGDELSVFKYQARVLLDVKYVSILKEKYPDMIVLVVPKLECVKFYGTKYQIEDGKKMAEEILGKVKEHLFKLDSKSIGNFIKNREFDFIQWLRSKSAKCQVSSKGSDIVIYYSDSSELKKCQDLIKNDLKTYSVYIEYANCLKKESSFI